MPVSVLPAFTAGTLIWLAISILIGLAYAWLLYRTANSLSENHRKLFFACRAVTVASIAFLLGAPLIKSVTKNLEKPLIIIAQDNSASIKISTPRGFDVARYIEELKSVEKTLANDYELISYSFGDSVTSSVNFNFQDKTTDIASVFTEISQRFAGRNIGSIILATDGIYNKGGTPETELAKIKAPVFTVALGDPVPKRDVLITGINYNNIVFTGNRFEIKVDVEAYQAKGAATNLTVSGQGQSVTKSINITSNDFRQSIPVIRAIFPSSNFIVRWLGFRG